LFLRFVDDNAIDSSLDQIIGLDLVSLIRAPNRPASPAYSRRQSS
jgi:hypothetical protein